MLTTRAGYPFQFSNSPSGVGPKSDGNSRTQQKSQTQLMNFIRDTLPSAGRVAKRRSEPLSNS